VEFDSNAPMLTLYHHPICPHSRYIRLALGEYGLSPNLIEEEAWARREDFLLLNPAGTIPVLVEEGKVAVPEAPIIAEYLDETYGGEMGERRLMPSARGARVEVRRLASWFSTKFYDEVSGPLATERFYKRRMPAHLGGGPPDTDVIRAARSNIRYHLAYIGWLLQTRDWLAGERLSYADLAAAAHLSVVDYLGDVPWSENDTTKNWYARVKSRPAFRPVLADRVAGLPPSATYANLDF
jgi:glutathione S-transferase